MTEPTSVAESTNPDATSKSMEPTNQTPDSPPLLQSLMDQLLNLRNAKKILTKEIDALTEKYDRIKDQIIEILDMQGTRGAMSKTATVAISESEIPSVEDKLAFWEYVRNTDGYELLDLRPGITATRELHHMGTNIPGLKFITVRRLSLTAIKGKK
jgi:hypothetical protein